MMPMPDRRRGHGGRVLIAAALVFGLACSAGAAEPKPGVPAPPPETAPPQKPDPFKDLYKDYRPDSVELLSKNMYFGGPLTGYRVTQEEMKVSSEPGFFTLNMLPEDARAIALVDAAMVKEQKDQYRDAARIYHMVIDKFPSVMYRVSNYGVFVPVSQYCQRRLLLLPPADLAHYRTLYDARAREEFESARKRNSLIGMSELTDSMLATSFGGPATIELGNAAMDSGDYLGALEHFSTVRDYFPPLELRTPELNLKMEYCQKMLGRQPGSLPAAGQKTELAADRLAAFEKLVSGSPVAKLEFSSQRASAPHVAADDYAPLPPTTDPLGLKDPVWACQLPGARSIDFVYTQPVVAGDSVIYRYRNIVYCHSTLNGLLRWRCDIGGRATWQNRGEQQYPMEDVLVQDGLVFTPMHKGGPSLVAIDQVTGQLRWAYGPMVSATEDEARMRFEAAPAGGLRTVYANYVLDNIEGETHTDTEYGVVALESTTGRLKWRTTLGTLAPGQFSSGFAVRRRNKIRSFTSPPLFHEGTVYTTNNAGAIAALDALSGRVKWLTRYPYYPGIHDATRPYGDANLWFNQRPLLVGDRLYVLPVDTRFMFCIDRGTGKVFWSRLYGAGKNRYGGLTYGGATCFLGPMSTGELVFVNGNRWESVQIVDPATGKNLWTSPDIIMYDDQPVMKYSGYHNYYGQFEVNKRWVTLSGRPFLASDDTLCIPTHCRLNFGHQGLTYGWMFNLSWVSLRDQKITFQRRYYAGEVIAMAALFIYTACPSYLKQLQEITNADTRLKEIMQMVREVIADHVPRNQYGPFEPFARVTFERYGVPFELRFGPREVQMVYDRVAVVKSIESRADPAADLARAELAVGDARYADAAAMLKNCLTTLSSEDIDLRAMIRQQLYQVHKELVRSGIRAARAGDELENGLGMSRTASVLADEIETLFALSESYERKGDPAAAARCLRSIITVYGHREHPIPVAAVETGRLLGVAGTVFDSTAVRLGDLYGAELGRPLALLRKGLPLYSSAVSPLPKPITVRAGEFAAERLIRLQNVAPQFAAEFDAAARKDLAAAAPGGDDELLYRLREFPGTPAAQQTLDSLLAKTKDARGFAGRVQLWRLADTARVGGLRVAPEFAPLVSAPPAREDVAPIVLPLQARKHDFADPEEMARLLLERRDGQALVPDRLFIGGRVRKRLDNKFVLTCYDLKAGKVLWDADSIRLRGRGDESGFREAFVFRDLVVVHGLYDVLAFGLEKGDLRWRYRVPFDFEIRHAVMSGDLLILAGQGETVALHLATASANGDVVWQEKEEGDLYFPPFFIGPPGAPPDRLVSLRRMPFSITVRFRATGRLIGRLELPDLTLCEKDPLFDDGPEAFPIARDGERLVVSDGWYYIAVDALRLSILWKRLIDSNDPTREPAMRFALKGEYLAVVKEDYDRKAIYMLSSRTGEVLWATDPKVREPLYSFFIEGETLYGCARHPGQGFYMTAVDCKTSRELFRQEVGGYQARPAVVVEPRTFGTSLAATIQDRQDFELRVFDATTGRVLHTVKDKGVGPIGVPGRVSAVIQGGRLVLLCKDKLTASGP